MTEEFGKFAEACAKLTEQGKYEIWMGFNGGDKLFGVSWEPRDRSKEIVIFRNLPLSKANIIMLTLKLI
ncbi:MAG: hypothetical protein RSA62_05920, partial [Oscillospiraceae bacterium]